MRYARYLKMLRAPETFCGKPPSEYVEGTRCDFFGYSLLYIEMFHGKFQYSSNILGLDPTDNIYLQVRRL